MNLMLARIPQCVQAPIRRISPPPAFRWLKPVKFASAFILVLSQLSVVLNSPAQTCVSVPSGLVAWWAGEFSAQDQAGSNHGSLQNGTTFSPGQVSTAFSFDGIDDHVSIPASAILDVGAGSGFTLEFWLQPSNTSSQQVIAEWNDGAGGVGVHLMHSIGALGGFGSLFANIVDNAGGSHYFATASGVLVAGNLYHIALTYDKAAGSAKIFVNGTQTASESVGTFTPQTSYALYLGTRFSGLGAGAYQHGLLDEVSLYNRALNEFEIQAIHASGSAGKCSTPTVPVIFSQPTNQTVTVGDNATLRVLAGGTSPLTYQWRFEGTNIDGATDNPLVLLAVMAGDAGAYSVAVSNNVGGVISSNAVLTVNPPPPCVPSPAGMVSWWRGEGDGIDAVGGNDGALQGGLAFGIGKVGQALIFNGTDAAVAISSGPNLDVGAGSGLTIETWIRPASITEIMPLVEWNSGSGGNPYGVHLWTALGGAGSLFANLVDTAGIYHGVQTAPGLLTTGDFQHVALNYDKATGMGKLYLNGQVVAQENLGTFTPQTSYNCYLGFRPAGGVTRYVGDLDEVSIYARALTDLEIQAVFGVGKSGKCLGPVPPFIFSQPTNQTVFFGTNVTFNVLAAGTAPLEYQWRFNGFPIPGATNTSLTLTNVGTNQSGLYAVTLTNMHGFTNSSAASLTVLVHPASILLQPTNQTVPAGETATLSVAASGTAPLGYQWTFNGDLLPMATHGSLVITNFGTNQAGVYAVTVTNLFGSETSSNATLAVVFLTTNLFDDFDPGIDPPQWSSFGGSAQATNHGGFVSPSNSLWFGGTGSRFAVTRSINTTNSWDLRFHLRFGSGAPPFWDRPELPADGVVLEYSTNAGVNWIEFGRYNTAIYTNWTPLTARLPASAKVPSARFRWRQLANNGSSSDHWVLDDVLLTTIATPPDFVAHPLDQTINAGGTAIFNASAIGSLPLYYQWRRNGADILGETNSSLTLTNAQPSQVGDYTVLIANTAGLVVSSNALLKVIVLSAFGNGQPLTNSTHYFSGPISVELTNVYADGLVFYTLDGSTPSFLSSQYTGTFPVSHSVQLRAIGYRADFLEFGELGPIAILMVPSYSLSVTSAGGGSVALDPPGGLYPSNTVVALTALPGPGWTFLKWLGDANGAGVSTNVTVNRNESIQAVFGTVLNTTAGGGGSVVLNPPGAVYPFGSIVLLSAVPTAGNQFGIWGNAASGNVNPLLLAVTNANPTVSALFGPVSSGQSALTVVPVGRGQITIAPQANAYATGSGVSITATPEAGQSFLGWSGDAAGTVNPLPLTVNASKLIYANFTKRPRLQLAGDINRITSEGARLLLATDPGDHCEIAWSSNLTSWTQLVLLTNAGGIEQVADPAATNSVLRFYRAGLTE